MGALSFDWLTQTKFMPPALRDDIVQRRRLLELLHASIRSHPLTLISAPAGYGKTTLLTSLAAAFPDVCVTWISLDEEDNDPARFFATLIGAVQRANPGLSANLSLLLASLPDPASDARRLIGALINETLAHPGEMWVVLDDLHLITEPSIFAALDYWLERMPPHMHLIVAARHDPPLVLARLRARGQLAEVRVPHLRFTTEEARDFLNEKQSLGLSPDDLVQLQTRAEGWAAGLRLLAGSLDRLSAIDRTAFIQYLAHTERHVFEFLAEEVLKRQEPAMRAFLLETSILPELTPALCAALTGRADAQALLEDLTRRHLFLTQVDAQGTVCRYHALFADFLGEQLKREMPECIPDLHRRAGDAQRTIAPARAITHYLAARLWDDAAQCIETISEQFMAQGFLKTLRGWIEALPEPARTGRPRLLYALGFCALQLGELGKASEWLGRAQSGFESSGDRAGQGETIIAMIDLTTRLHDFGRLVQLMDQAEGFPLPAHGQAMLLVSRIWATLFRGDMQQADALMDKAIELALTSEDVRVFIALAPNLTLQLLFLPGGIARFENYCRHVLSRFGDNDGLLQIGAHSLLGFFLILSGRVDEAVQEAEQARAISRRIGELVYTEGQIHMVMGTSMMIRGDYAGAERYWQAQLAWAEQPAVAVALPGIYSLIGKAQWMQKKFDQARQTNARISAMEDNVNFSDAALSRRVMRGLVEMSDHEYDKAEQTLGQAVSLETTLPYSVLFGSARFLLAYLYWQQKREPEAWSVFKPFLVECEQRRTPGLILREAALAIPLLRMALERKSHVDFARRLLEVLDQAGGARPIKVPDTGETLTPREVEILKLIEAGASNQAIAKQLVISEHTVKVHVTNILAKLSASSRTHAAARARELHLVL